MRKPVSARRQKKNDQQKKLDSIAQKSVFNRKTDEKQVISKNSVNDIQKTLELLTSEYEGKISSLNEQLNSMLAKCQSLESRLKDAQLIRSNHWRKYEIEKLKNKLLGEQVLEQDKVIKKFETSLSWSLGNIIIKFFNKKMSIETMASLVLNEYVIYRNKVGKGSEVSIDLFVQRLVERKLSTFNNGLTSKVLLKYSHRMIESILLKIKKELEISDKVLDVKPSNHLSEVKFFLNSVEKKAVEIYEASEKKVATKKNQYKSKALKLFKDLNVAVIFDEFTYECFKYEFNTHIIEPNTWKKIFEEKDIDIFFCESAWSGVDSVRRPWKGQIYASKNFAKENRGVLLEILQYCKENGIPTVFWNKEDPTHYPDEVHCFTKTAILFDHIFTVSEECVEKYKQDFNFQNVHLLPFATQPRMFNPIETKQRIQDISFAGSWYANHLERSQDMENIFDNIIKSGKKLKIYDRFHGTDDVNHIFPEKYKEYTLPPVKFSDIDKVYKESTAALTMNTVKDSKTMIARRAFELMSCNTLVLSNFAVGMHHLFPNMFLDLESDPQALTKHTENELSGMRENALKHVLGHHTYSVRWRKILQDISFNYLEARKNITCCFYVDDINEINKIILDYEVGSKLPIKLLFILSEAFDVSERMNTYMEYNNEFLSCVVESYLDKYTKDVNAIIDTPYAAIIDKNMINWIDCMDEALLHLEYLEDRVMLLDQGEKYHLMDSALIENVVFKKERFKEFNKKNGQKIDDQFYSLNTTNNGV